MLSHHKAAVIHGASFSSSPIKKKKIHTTGRLDKDCSRVDSINNSVTAFTRQILVIRKTLFFLPLYTKLKF